MVAFSPGRNHGLRTLPGQGGYQLGRAQVLEQRQGLRCVVAGASREAYAQQLVTGVGHQMQLAGQTAAAAPWGLWSVFSCAQRVRVRSYHSRIDQQRVLG
jgi:hypothetical protein